MTRAIINTIWIGPEMGPLHTACLTSFLLHGHRVILHCYDRPVDAPAGVEISDAGLLLPNTAIFRHRKTGSFAIFADLLRYEILRADLGVYVDCDVFCLRPIDDADYIFGWQTGVSINNAVLKLPPGCPALAELCAIKEHPYFIPPWQPKARQRRWRLERFLGRGRTLADLPWGTTGPDALTWYLCKHNLADHARPIDVFYPVAHYQTTLLFERGLSIADLTTRRTVALHLYSDTLRARSVQQADPNSPLAEIMKATAAVG